MKKVKLLLSVLGLIVVLAGCSSSSAISDYLSENEEMLTSIFDTMGLGTLRLSTSGDNELVATFAITADQYEDMEALIPLLGVEGVGDVLEAFIDASYSASMYQLAGVIANEADLSSARIRLVITLENQELANIVFDSE